MDYGNGEKGGGGTFLGMMKRFGTFVVQFFGLHTFSLTLVLNLRMKSDEVGWPVLQLRHYRPLDSDCPN